MIQSDLRKIRLYDKLKNIETNLVETVIQIDKLYFNGGLRRRIVSTDETFNINPKYYILLKRDKHGRKIKDVKRTNGRTKK